MTEESSNSVNNRVVRKYQYTLSIVIIFFCDTVSIFNIDAKICGSICV